MYNTKIPRTSSNTRMQHHNNFCTISFEIIKSVIGHFVQVYDLDKNRNIHFDVTINFSRKCLYRLVSICRGRKLFTKRQITGWIYLKNVIYLVKVSTYAVSFVFYGPSTAQQLMKIRLCRGKHPTCIVMILWSFEHCIS